MSQGSLFDAPPVPRATPGTYLSPSGADMKGPLVVICEGCNMPAMYRPAVGPCACPTPAAHTWTGEQPEEDVMETTPITPEIHEEIARQVDVVLALTGEGGDDPKALRAAIDAELGHGDFIAWPVKRGQQIEFLEQLAQVVLERLRGTPMQEAPKTGPRVQTEGFDDDSASAPIIRHPIG